MHFYEKIAILAKNVFCDFAKNAFCTFGGKMFFSVVLLFFMSEKMILSLSL